MFQTIYRRALEYARHPHAPWYLALLSFAESSFFPVPPDVLLIPMALAAPGSAWRLALLTTIASALGGLLGYGIGYFAFALVEPWLQQWGYWEAYLTAREWFDRWGFWAVFIAGFSPIPYKVFTIAAGTLTMNLPLFLLASLVGRGSRFFLEAGLVVWGGERLEQAIYRHINRIGWWMVAIAVAAAGLRWLLR